MRQRAGVCPAQHSFWCGVVTAHVSLNRHCCSGRRCADPEGHRSLLHKRKDAADPELK